MKKLVITIAAFVALLGVGVVAANSIKTNALNVDKTRNHGASAVIKGGTMNEAELQAGLKKSPSARAFYDKIGIPKSFNGSKRGVMKTNGDIVVGNQTVAKNAHTFGRTPRTGDIGTITAGGQKFYKHHVKHAFTSATPVHVFFDQHGRFTKAIADVCGNPVVATPTKPKASATCDSLTATAQTRTKYSFTAKGSVKNGAVTKKYTFDFGDGKKVTTTNKNVTHTYAKPGTYTVRVTIHTSAGDKTSANCKTTVTVKKPEPKPAASCTNLNAAAVNRTKFNFKATATVKNGATVKNYTYDFGDGNKKTSTSNQISHTYAKPGTYKVTVTANTSVGNKTSANCETTVTVKKEEPKPAATCENLTAQKLDRTKYEFTATADTQNGATVKDYTFDFGDGNKDTVESGKTEHTYDKPGTYKVTVTANTSVGNKTSADCETEVTVEEEPAKPIEVCEVETGKIVTIDEDEFDEKVHSHDLDDCKPEETPETPETPEKPETPETPVTELPETGTAGTIASGIGITSLIAGLGYYVSSRRML